MSSQSRALMLGGRFISVSARLRRSMASFVALFFLLTIGCSESQHLTSVPAEAKSGAESSAADQPEGSDGGVLPGMEDAKDSTNEQSNASSRDTASSDLAVPNVVVPSDEPPGSVGAGPGGRSVTHPAKPESTRPPVPLWPKSVEKEAMKEHAVEVFQSMLLEVCTGTANEEGFSYWADKEYAYEFAVPNRAATPRPVVEITGERLRYDQQGNGSYTLGISITCPDVTVRSKPARFEKFEYKHYFSANRSQMPMVFESDFPALLPWSEPNEFPEVQFSITYRQGEDFGKAWQQKQGRAAYWLSNIRPLDKDEMAKLLNLDQSEFLSDAGRKQYQTFRDRLSMMMGHKGDSLVILQNQLFLEVATDDPGNPHWGHRRLEIPRGENGYNYATSGARLIHALRAGEYDEVDLDFPVYELPSGKCQIWLAEDEVSEIDQLNGIEFRGKLFIVVRGYERGRYLNFWKWSGKGRDTVRVKPSAGWGDWVEPATRVGALKITVDDGKATWEFMKDELGGRKQEEVNLDDWCFTQAEKARLLEMLDVTDKQLVEKPAWPALPF